MESQRKEGEMTLVLQKRERSSSFAGKQPSPTKLKKQPSQQE